MGRNGEILSYNEIDEPFEDEDEAPRGSAPTLSSQLGEDLEDSDDDIFLGDVGIGMDEYDAGGAVSDDDDEDAVVSGMKRGSSGRGTKLMTVSNRSVTDVGKRKKSINNAFMAPLRLSEPLAALLGVETLPRTEVTKKIWVYIKAKNLQNPSDKREIICDTAMQAVLGVPRVNMFAMTKILSKHMFKDEEVHYLHGDEDMAAAKRIKSGAAVKAEQVEWNAGGGKTRSDLAAERKAAKVIKKAENGKLVKKGASMLAAERKKKKDKEAKKAADKAKRKALQDAGLLPKRAVSENNPFMRPCALSPQLSALVGGETQMARPAVVKRMWELIREGNLQNPADKREILCDKAMQRCFGVDRFTMFSMNKYLAEHLTAIEQKPAAAAAATATATATATAASSSSSSSSSGKEIFQVVDLAGSESEAEAEL
jgi:upstream activation factor subunit UAF30